MTDSAAAIAAFLAKGGKVNKIDAGVNSGISDRAFFLASRGDISLRANPEDETRWERQMEACRETRFVGGTESQALDAMRKVE